MSTDYDAFVTQLKILFHGRSRDTLLRAVDEAMPVNTTKKVRMVCCECGSEDVLADAYAKWDFDKQEWTLQDVFDKGHYCADCDGECSIEERDDA